MDATEFNARLDRVEADFGDVIGGLRVESNLLLELPEAVRDFGRGVKTLPELLDMVKEDRNASH